MVNLGIGLPIKVADFIPPGRDIILHTENGMLGMGPRIRGEGADPELINAAKIPVSELPGASYFDHAESFAMIRGGHIDVCVMGAFQVSQRGDLANWSTGAAGAKSVDVMMSLFAKDGSPKLVPECTFPLTGQSSVSRVYTESAIFQIDAIDGVAVLETFGMSISELSQRLDVPLRPR